MKKFGLLVGNGFTLNFIESQGLNIHSSYPLKNFNSLEINYNNFIEYLPFVKNELFGQDKPDFDVIKEYTSKYAIDSFEVGQLKQFLSLSYSKFQMILDKYDYSSWRWTNWLQQNQEQLVCAISFNYDLVLERTLKNAGIPFSRIGTNESPKKVSLMKPHGSIDFGLSKRAFLLDFRSIFNSTSYLNDAGILEIVPKWEWPLPRTQADIVPPSVSNFQHQLSWVKTNFQEFKTKASEINALVIIGSSYWDVDRPEINFFLEHLQKDSIVYIANPEPDRELIKMIVSLGLTYEPFGFDELPW